MQLRLLLSIFLCSSTMYAMELTIDQLKEKHQGEIALYEEKITTLKTINEQQAKKIVEVEVCKRNQEREKAQMVNNTVPEGWGRGPWHSSWSY